jgi:hypothetical protein
VTKAPLPSSILTLDGWSLSRGVLEELKFAEDNFIPITYVKYK